MAARAANGSIGVLAGQKFINLTTFRKNGTPVSTPVTFAARDGKIYVVTGRNTGKVKRINNNPCVEFTASDWNGKPMGETMTALARILTAEEWRQIKPGMKFRTPTPMMFIFNRIRDLRAGGNVHLEIALA